MDLKTLDREVISGIRSTFNINSVSQCVTELVVNSLDANSNAIAIRVNLPKFRIQVVDNGQGISPENLNLVGHRYMTSKCHSLDDLKKRPKWYGFRGEALASICTITTTVVISSRQQGSNETFVKVIQNGKNGKVEKDKKRLTSGTTVTIDGFLATLPVRQQSIKSNELENVRRHLETFIIIHPQVSFSLRDDVSGRLLINNQKTSNITTAIKILHSEIDENKFSFVKVSKNNVKIKGLLYKDFIDNKKVQYIFVNKRPINHPKFRKIVQQHFEKFSISKGKKYAAFVIQIKCPNSEVEFLSTPAKNEAQFKNFELVATCLKKLLEYCNVGIKPTVETTKTKQFEFAVECGVSQIAGVIKGVASKRKSDKNCCLETPPESLLLKRNKSDSENKLQFPKNEDFQLVPPKFSTEGVDLDNTEFTNNERKGKDLIMDMFLKSTQVFPKKTLLTPETSVVDKTMTFDKLSALEFTVKKNSKKSSAIQTSIVQSPEWDQEFGKRTVGVQTDVVKINKENEKFAIPFYALEKRGNKNYNLPPLQIAKIQSIKNPFNATTLENAKLSPILPVEDKPVRDFGNQIDFVGEQLENCPTHTSPILQNKEFNFKPSNTSDKKIETFSALDQTKKLWQSFALQNNRNIEMKLETKRGGKVDMDKTSRFFNTTPNKFTFAQKDLTPTETYFSQKSGEHYNFNFKDPVGPKKKDISFQFLSSNNQEFAGNFFRNNSAENSHGFALCNYKNEKPRNEMFSFQFGNRNSFGPFGAQENLKANQIIFRLDNDKAPFLNPRCNDTFRSKYFENGRDARKPENSQLGPNSDFFSAGEKSTKFFSLNETEISYQRNDQQGRNTESEIQDKENIGKSDSLINKDEMIPTNETEIFITIGDEEKQKIIERERGLEKPIEFSFTESLNNEEEILEKRSESEWIKQTNNFGTTYYINTITGATTFMSPKEQMKFSITSRCNMIPKGLSQVCRKFEDVKVELNTTSKENLQNAILQSYEDELKVVKWQNYLENRDYEKFFEAIYREKAKQFEGAIANVNKNCFPKYISKDFGSFKFTKDIFQNLVVLGQIDCKFIAAFSLNLNLLLMFDQHAVHERIRLEILLEGYGNSSTKLHTTLTFFLPRDDLILLKNQSTDLKKIGLGFKIFPHGITIDEIPVCIYNKVQKGADLNELLQELIVEIIDVLRNNNGLIISTPKIIQNVINSEACRGAVKFGDELGKHECVQLISDLSQCDLPFQCAHGRPTVTPLVRINENQDEFLNVNLKKLRY